MDLASTQVCLHDNYTAGDLTGGPVVTVGDWRLTYVRACMRVRVPASRCVDIRPAECE